METYPPEPAALIFDLGKVIVPFDFARGYRALELLCPYPAAEIPGRIRQTGLVPLLETGGVAPDAFVEAIARELRIRITYSEFCALWNSIFLPGTLIPDDTIARLAGRYRLVLLSNTNQIHFEGIRENYPILRHFHDFVLSYQVGVMKPEAAIFRHAAQAAGCPASECVFIDDLAENVEGARRAGMPAIQFVSCPQLEEDLARHGVCFR